MSQFLKGFILVFHSINYLRNKPIRNTALLPILISVLVMTVLFVVITTVNYSLMNKLYHAKEGSIFVTILSWILGTLLFILSAIFVIVSFTFITNLVAGVFIEQLSAVTLAHLTGTKVNIREEPFLTGLRRTLSSEVQKLIFFLKRILLILALNLIPIVGTVLFSVFFFIYTIYALGFEFLSIPLELERKTFKEKRGFITAHRTFSLGLGLGILTISLIPVINLLYLPLAVISASEGYFRQTPSASLLVSNELINPPSGKNRDL